MLKASVLLDIFLLLLLATSFGLAATTPTKPTISEKPIDGTSSISGVAQKVNAMNYPTPTKVYVCVWPTAPPAGALDCIPKSAPLSNSVSNVNESSGYEPGQFVSVVSVSTPQPPGADQTTTSKVMEVPAPTTPAISGGLQDGEQTVAGTAQAHEASTYNSPLKVAVCVWPTTPIGFILDCTADKSATKPATLLYTDDPAGKANYVWTNQNGTFTAKLATPLKSGSYVSVVETPATPPNAAPVFSQAVLVSTAAATGKTSSLFTLALVGVNATGTSASGPTLQYFVSIDTLATVNFLDRHNCSASHKDEQGKRVWDLDPTHPLSRRCWVWLSPRIASAPSPSSTALTSFASPTSLASGAAGQTISQITQTFEFEGGLEYSLHGPWEGSQFGEPRGRSWVRDSVALVVAVGGSTPLNPVSNAPEFALNCNLGAQFANNPTLATIYPALAAALRFGDYNPPCNSNSTSPYTTVAFVLPNRSRFYRNYSAGLRLRSYSFTGACTGVSAIQDCTVNNTYPGTFDVRFGQDETVTGGSLKGVVMTLAGSYPLPGTGGTLRIFGASFLRLKGNQNTSTLALVPPAAVLPISNQAVVIQSILPSDQDYYRLGVGVDLVPLIAKWVGGSSKTTSGQ